MLGTPGRRSPLVQMVDAPVPSLPFRGPGQGSVPNATEQSSESGRTRASKPVVQAMQIVTIMQIVTRLADRGVFLRT
jgi:hypothetical protein